MNNHKWSIGLMTASLLATSPATADDVSTSPQLTNSIGVEVAPEFRALTGNLVDGYVKATSAHIFDNGLIWGSSFQYTDKVNGFRQYQPETTLGYNIKLNQVWSVPLSAGLGYRWDTDPKAVPSQAFGYYVLNAGLNMKISGNWTWNVISARYRDTFEGRWQTPKVATGLTYAIDRQNSVYGNIGYAWRNGQPNKISIAFGYKYGF